MRFASTLQNEKYIAEPVRQIAQSVQRKSMEQSETADKRLSLFALEKLDKQKKINLSWYF